MNIVQLLLASHILGSIFVGALVAFILFISFRNKAALYKSSALSLGLAAGYQFITGSLLVIAMPGAESLFSFCSKIGLYLSVILFAEVVLYMKMRQHSEAVFPAKAVVSSIGTGMVFVLTAVFTL